MLKRFSYKSKKHYLNMQIFETFFTKKIIAIRLRKTRTSESRNSKEIVGRSLIFGFKFLLTFSD
jgi:hypothetical protein